MNKIGIEINGSFVAIDHGSQILKNSLMHSLFVSQSMKDNLENELERIKNDIFILESIVLLKKEWSTTFNIIQSSIDPDECIKGLMEGFCITESQAVYFTESNLKNLLNIDYEKQLECLKECIVFFEKMYNLS